MFKPKFLTLIISSCSFVISPERPKFYLVTLYGKHANKQVLNSFIYTFNYFNEEFFEYLLSPAPVLMEKRRSGNIELKNTLCLQINLFNWRDKKAILEKSCLYFFLVEYYGHIISELNLQFTCILIIFWRFLLLPSNCSNIEGVH